MQPARLAQLVESIGDGVVAVDAAGAVEVCTTAALRLLGDRAVISAADFPAQQALRVGHPVSRDLEVKSRLGVQWARVRAWPVRDEAGAVIGAVAVICEVGPRSREELVARDAYVDILRIAADAESEEEVIAKVLETVCRSAGWAVGHAHLVCDMPPRFVASTTHYADDPARYAPFIETSTRLSLALDEGLPGAVLASGVPVYLSNLADDPRFVRAAAARQVGLGVGFAFPMRAGGEVLGVIELFAPEHAAPDTMLLEVLSDVGAQLGRVVQRERALAREHFMRQVLDSVGDAIFVKDRACRWVLLNRAFGDLVGFPCEVMVGKSDHDFFPKEQADFFRKKDLEMFASEARVSIEEEPITDATGNVHWLATTKVPLRDARAQVTHLVGIIHDITRLKHAEEELRRRNEELAREVHERSLAVEHLDAANRDLEGFCYSVSHDLRAPLRAIDGYSRLLEEDHTAELSPEALRALDRVRVNVKRMSQLIDDLLALSRVSRVPLEVIPVDLAAMARDIFAELARQEPDRDVKLIVGEGLAARADPRLARVLLENLIGNAWKFTTRRPHAVIEVGQEGGRFFVRDNGAGFDMAYVHMLFKPFSRLHRSEDYPGTGVGLASVKRVVERHGGQVSAEGAIDKGAVVWFTLAPGGVQTAAQPAPPAS